MPSASKTEPGQAVVETDESLALWLADGDTAAGELLVRRFHEPLMRDPQLLWPVPPSG